jgi:RimJ/RimL family protein N-acetyltransferase
VHLDTERLYLRPMTIRDVDDLVALHADPDVSRYMRAFDREEAVQRLRRDATGAARACAAWGFAEFNYPYLTAMIRADNARSIKVAERLGMTPLREDVLFDVPVLVHAVSRETFTES